jgi:hypothetical protein
MRILNRTVVLPIPPIPCSARTTVVPPEHNDARSPTSPARARGSSTSACNTAVVNSSGIRTVRATTPLTAGLSVRSCRLLQLLA